MSHPIKKAKQLADYKPSDFEIHKTYLDFSLFDGYTLVTSKLVVKKINKRVKNLKLHGEDLELFHLAIDGKSYDQYEVLNNQLIVRSVPDSFELSTQVRIIPEKNTKLEGLYRSSDIFCTQCEAEGFRRITYFLDRPDVMSLYKVRIEADQKKVPVLLSNGNLSEQGTIGNSRHYAIWEDPFKKPSYLFALVAGDLDVIEKTFITKSKREVLLQIYTEKNFIHQADYALGALERAMVWDEETFNLEYDLDRYMIVAIRDFNMGAMENKGLNVFNSKYVLATKETATDDDFLAIENIIGHEYFHNWTGNRVTCRDWFQLSLKEGLTVFRDSLFAADMTEKGVTRLKESRLVREHQFIEDQGPMSHPVRPDSYIEINNFYTLTVYEKGAEVIRLIYNLLGEAVFKEGLQLYLTRHDGQAVTVEDFVQAMSDASRIDLTEQFFKWYTQSGTPQLEVDSEYDSESKIFKIKLAQTYTDSSKENLVIPVSYRLFDEQGNSMSSQSTTVLDQSTKVLEFGSISKRPILSVLRSFSAPVRINFDQSIDDLHTLARYDDDLFVRFNSLQKIYRLQLDEILTSAQVKTDQIAETIRLILLDENTPNAEKAQLLSYPDLAVFYADKEKVNVKEYAQASQKLKSSLIESIQSELVAVCSSAWQYDKDDLTFSAMAERSYRNACLLLLSESSDETVRKLIRKQYDESTLMTNRIAALKALNGIMDTNRQEALEHFYQIYQTDPQVMDKWFVLQSTLNSSEVIDQIKALSNHPLFSLTNPNKVRALYGAFAMQNHQQFHHESGAGYQLLTDVVIELNSINPSIAARLVTPLTQWRRYDLTRQKLMHDCLKRIDQTENLAKDLLEVIGKSL